MEAEPDDLEATLRMVGADHNKATTKRIADLIAQTGREILYKSMAVYPYFDEKFAQHLLEDFPPDLIVINLHSTYGWNRGSKFWKERDFWNDITFEFRDVERYHNLFPETPIIAYSPFITDDTEDRRSNRYKSRAIRCGAVAALPARPHPDVERILKYVKV